MTSGVLMDHGGHACKKGRNGPKYLQPQSHAKKRQCGDIDGHHPSSLTSFFRFLRPVESLKRKFGTGEA